MKTDFSNINSEADLDKATQDISERIEYSRRQIKKDSQELPRSVAREAIRKTAPWVVGAVAGLAATLLIRKLTGRSKRVPMLSPAISSASKSPVTGKVASALAVQLLPIAGLVLKNWLSRKRIAKTQMHE